jgi:hypothetical protein
MNARLRTLFAIVAAGGKHPGASPGTADLTFHVTDYDAFVAARAAQGITPVSTSDDPMGPLRELSRSRGQRGRGMGTPTPRDAADV